MKASIAIQVLPQTKTQDEMIAIIDKVIEYIQSTGLNCVVGPFETTIEGESLDQLMEIVNNAHKLCIENGATQVSGYVKVVYAKDKEILSIDEKISKYSK